ncbi:MAG: cellulose binding domain-containing protein, partial [Clostridium sp.]
MKKIKKLVAMAVAVAIVSSFYVKDVKAFENVEGGSKLATVSTIDVNDGSIQKRVTIKNITSQDIPVNSISIKYFMTSEGDYNFNGGFYDLKGIESNDLKLSFEKPSDEKKQDTYDSEVLISNSSSKILKPNEEISFSFNIWNWASLDSKNDFSNNENIAIYQKDGSDNKLIQGEQPQETGTRIGTIQGASHKSPYEGQLVSKITGIVTSVSNNGFYMQDKYGDDLTQTSDAIFIFTKSKPTAEVGDYLNVDGKVEEFAYKGELSKTEIVEPKIETLSKNNILPKEIVIGKSGLKEINKVIDNDGLGTFDPEEDGIDFYESLEGMRVSIENPTVTGFADKFNELTIVSNNIKDEDKTISGGIFIS